MENVALVGLPNSGKTTLFNALTGESAKVGNYAGITVSVKKGEFRSPHGRELSLVDLPGCYSLSPRSKDEQVTYDYLVNEDGVSPVDLLLCVVDSSDLQRQLPLLSDLMALEIPCILVLNKVDLLDSSVEKADIQGLSERLGMPVLPINAMKQSGILELKQAIRHPLPVAPHRAWRFSEVADGQLHDLEELFVKSKMQAPKLKAQMVLGSRHYRESFLESFPADMQKESESVIEQIKAEGLSAHDEWFQAREKWSAGLVEKLAFSQASDKLNFTDKLDRWLLHPIFGSLALLGAMFILFFSLFTLAGYPMGWIESLFEGVTGVVANFLPDGDFKDLLLDGVIAGIGGVLVFLPQIILLFILIALFETSGYLARGAYLMDRLMGLVGLSGKSFVPLLSSYACAIPGIMSTRTLTRAKERLLTILIAPWMSCAARLPVYILMIAVLWGDEASSAKKAWVMLSLYLIGTVTSFVVAAILRKGMKLSRSKSFFLELPRYQAPDWRFALKQGWQAGFNFFKTAGTIILSISIVIWFLQTYPKEVNLAKISEDSVVATQVESLEELSESQLSALQVEQSWLGRIGRFVEPVFEPLGYDWRITTAVLCSFSAREVFASVMGVLFQEDGEDIESLSKRMQKATRADGSKLFSPATSWSILIFYIYALQCFPTTVTVRRETNSWGWALGQLAGMSIFAYVAALLVYQVLA